VGVFKTELREEELLDEIHFTSPLYGLFLRRCAGSDCVGSNAAVNEGSRWLLRYLQPPDYFGVKLVIEVYNKRRAADTVPKVFGNDTPGGN